MSRRAGRIVLSFISIAIAIASHASTIRVDDASNKSTANCTLTQAIVLANLAANGGPAPDGQTPPGSTTVGPLHTYYYTWSATGNCAIVADAHTGTVIDLSAIAGATIAYSSPDVMYNSWYGWAALPPIASDITIDGHGVTLVGLQGAGASDMYGRLFFIGADARRPETPGYNTPGPGKLTLIDLSLIGGGQRARSSSKSVAGGGAGMGGAIFNQGTLSLINVTLSTNEAIGAGFSEDAGASTTGGGMASVRYGTDMGARLLPDGGTDAGLWSTDFSRIDGNAGGGTTNGLGGTGGSTLTCCGLLGGVGAPGGRGSGGGGGGNANYSDFPGGGGFGGGPSGVGDDFATLSHGDGGGGGIGTGGQDSGGGGGFAGGGGSSLGNASVQPASGGSGGFGGGGGGSLHPIPGSDAKGGYGGGDATGAFGGGGAGMGGAIFNFGGIVTVLNSTIRLNKAFLGGGQQSSGQAMGAAIFNLNGQVAVSFSTIAHNGVGVADTLDPNCCTWWGDAIYSVAYNGSASSGSSLASVVINNSVIIESADDGSGTTLVLDQPAMVSGGLTNVATQAFATSGKNLVRQPLSRNNAPAMPAFDFDFYPNLLASNATGPWVEVPLEISLLGISDCKDAFGNAVTTDQRGLPRPASECDIGAVQRQHPLLATSAGNALFVQGPASPVAPIVVDPAIALTATEPSLTGLASASVTISANYAANQDVLVFSPNASTMGNIIGTAFDPAANRLVLTSPDASATPAQWQAALRAVSYRNTLAAPTPANTVPRSVTYTINDGLVGSNATTRTVQVYAFLRLSAATLADGVVGSAYGSAISAAGGTGSYTFTLGSGALPPGIDLSPSGALSGTPTASGRYDFSAITTDGVGTTAGGAFTLVVAPRSSSTLLAASSASSVEGEAVTLSTTVTGTAPSGTVTIFDAATPLCSALTLLAGSATCTVSTLTFGTHTLTAHYGGDINHLASDAPALTHVVEAQTSVALASPCALTLTADATFTLSATVSGHAPAGTLTFWRDTTVALCSDVTLQDSIAQCTTTALGTVAGHAQDKITLTASYAGDDAHAPSVSQALSVNVLSASETLFRDGFDGVIAGCANH